MKLTTFSDYTLRVLMFLALNRERLATIPEIAAAYDISENHLMKVVHQLARSGVIESVRGTATCRIAPACRLTKILVRAFDALYAALDDYTLADLVKTPRALEAILLHR